MLAGLHDLWTVLRWQKHVERLDLKGSLLRPASPFVQATARSMPGFDVWSGRVLTVTRREEEHEGFIQARWRHGLPVLDLLCIAPSLSVQHGAAWVWHDLLHELVRVGSERKVQRLFAHLPEERHAEVEVLRQAGFAIYAQDRLFRLERLPTVRDERLAWRPRTLRDAWGLSQLYHELTPSVVQQAEQLLGSPESEDGRGSWLHYAGWLRTHRRAYVLPGESEGQILGYLKLTQGTNGHWLKLVLHPSQEPHADELVAQALSLLRSWPTRPLYCDIRRYEESGKSALERVGFEEVTTRILLVRQTTASMKIKSPVPATVKQAVGETAVTYAGEGRLPFNYEENFDYSA